MTSFYDERELQAIGFQSVGKNVKISRKASFYGVSRISIGDCVRIDDFCVLSGAITIGNHVHIAAYVALFAGDAGVYLGDYVGISSQSTIYAVTDDYSGATMSNPTVPDEYKQVREAPVVLEKHVLVGTGCTVLPGVKLAEGTSVGAMSLVNRSTKPWGMYFGTPAKYQKERSRKLLQLCEEFEKSEK